MSNISDIVKSFIDRYKLEKDKSPYIVAFSGGYDSMCLLDVLSKLTDKKIIAIHLNHNWRGNESNREEDNCRKFCEQIGVDFYSEKLTSEIPKTETAARDARYLFFEKCAEEFLSDIVFTAHNADDNAETLIYRIAKGTGVDGLSGIAEHRDIYYRPLLSVRRTDIEKYCIDNSLCPNNDSSNTNIKYKRNLIRQKIMPLLKEINENAVSSINSLSETAKEDSLIWDELVSDIGDSTERFVSSPVPVQSRYIKRFLVTNGLDYDKERLSDIRASILNYSTSKSGKTLSLSTNLMLYVNSQKIEVLFPKSDFQISVKVDAEGEYETVYGTLKIEKVSKIPKIFPKDADNIAYVNLNKIDFDLRVRRDGDIIFPLGNCGSQKLKKYLNEKKIPQHEKSSLLFLARNNEIFWAIGLGISDKIKVTNKVTHRLQFIKNKEAKL